MLTGEDIRRIARRLGLNVGLIEKDYIIDWLLKELYESGVKEGIIFKGGTAIKKVYYPKTWRFSHDLDFSSLLKQEKIKNEMEEILKTVEENSVVS